MKIGRWAAVLVVLAYAAAVATAVAVRDRVMRERREVRAAALAVDSVDASGDSTRLVLVAGSGEGVGDGGRVWERRAIQAEQRADALDRALGRERAALAELRVAVPVVDTAVAVAAGDARVIREPPYTVELTRSSRAPTDSVVGVRVSMDTLALSVRIGCGAPRGGVRPATVAVAAPVWATVSLSRVEQEPRVCNPERPDHGAGGGSRLRDAMKRVGVNVGYGAVTMPDGAVRLKPVVAVGIRIWP